LTKSDNVFYTEIIQEEFEPSNRGLHTHSSVTNPTPIAELTFTSVVLETDNLGSIFSSELLIINTFNMHIYVDNLQKKLITDAVLLNANDSVGPNNLY